MSIKILLSQASRRTEKPANLQRLGRSLQIAIQTTFLAIFRPVRFESDPTGLAVLVSSKCMVCLHFERCATSLSPVHYGSDPWIASSDSLTRKPKGFAH